MIKNILCFILTLFCTFNSFSFTIAFSDYYIDRVTGKQLGSDGSKTNNLRVIDRREWDYVIEEKGGTYSRPGIRELHKNSYIISVDENQIQQEIQKVADDTMKEGLENQVFIVLNVNTGKIFAVRDWIPELKTNKEIVINTYGVGLNSAPRVGEGLMLLAQLHGHPKEMRKDKKNVRTVSEFDIKVAKHLGITVFAIDAFDSFVSMRSKSSYQYSRALHMHKVTKDGRTRNFVGKTFGRNGFHTFNFSDYFDLMLRKDEYAPIL
ncbi:hypothetical protein [Aquimarina sp. 2201CG14-23]|uniref:hypothetical protein n=1 Tax=Aquimarina mycalae TaxID=3040073 RepID=UPI002477F92B|nr:hypothetical protein [Aquimarina sp. 2201CG14-23]MDH7445769.1 hypothetical protein [Aquimarina sp. 2201CG14-23]